MYFAAHIIMIKVKHLYYKITILNRWIGIQNIVILKTKQVIVETESRCTIDPPPTAASGRVFFLNLFLEPTLINFFLLAARKLYIFCLSLNKIYSRWNASDYLNYRLESGIDRCDWSEPVQWGERSICAR